VLELLNLVKALVDPAGLAIEAAAEVEVEVPELEKVVEVELIVLIEFRQLVDDDDDDDEPPVKGRAVG